MPAQSVSKGATIAGWVLTALPAPLLLFSASGKFLMPAQVSEGFAHLGWPTSAARALGVVEIACTLLVLVPRTAVLGAVLLTGYMGGAMASHIRIGEPWFMQAGVAVIVWLGLFLRDARVRALLPLRSPPAQVP